MARIILVDPHKQKRTRYINIQRKKKGERERRKIKEKSSIYNI